MYLNNSLYAKQKFKCLLTKLKYCREDLVVQADYYCSLILLNYNLSLENGFAELCTVTHFNTSKSSCLISRPGKVGSYKQPLIFSKLHMVPSFEGEAALSLR